VLSDERPVGKHKEAAELEGAVWILQSDVSKVAGEDSPEPTLTMRPLQNHKLSPAHPSNSSSGALSIGVCCPVQAS
jgi:hypothetical protein